MRAKGFMSLGTRLALSTLAVLTVLSTIVFIGLARRERASLVASKAKAATMVADLAATALVAPLDFGDAKDVQTSLDNLKSNHEITFAAVWGTESDQPLATLGTPPAAGPSTEGKSFIQISGDHIELGKEIRRPDGGGLGRAVITFSLDAENSEFRARSLGILGATTACSVAAALLLILIARIQIIRPLGRLARAAERLGKGEKGVFVRALGKDEIGQLGGAFNAMSAAIVDRETRLALATSRLREVLDHMRQAIVVFGKDGVVDELRSNAATKLFGAGAAGRHIRDLLFRTDDVFNAEAQLFDAWVEVAFTVPESDWAELAETAPQEVTLSGERSAALELEFRPIFDEGAVARVMLIATDVTERKRLEAEVQSQNERHEQQLTVMRRLVAGSGPAFASFLQSSDTRLSECHALLQETDLAASSLARVLEIVHTLRGEARAYELQDVADQCAAIEAALVPLRVGDRAAKERWKVLRADVIALSAKSGQEIDAARELFIEASPIGRAILDQTTVRKSDLTKLQALVTKDGGELARVVECLTSRPFGECTGPIEGAAVRWAEAEGKSLVLGVHGRDVRVPPALANSLGGLLSHLIRNCIAHGLETAEERLAAGKPETGKISLTADDSGDSVVISVSDDGRGVNEDRVREKSRGTPYEGATVEDQLFAPGLTTAHTRTELAGLGVGLSAVREELRTMGYQVGATWEKGRGTTFTLAKQTEAAC